MFVLFKKTVGVDFYVPNKPINFNYIVKSINKYYLTYEAYNGDYHQVI